MFDWAYKRRLRDDLESWVASGWLSAEGAAAILDDQDEDDGRSRLPMALAGIGMVCIALALFAFIAANWGLIPKPAKLAGIAALVVAANGAAAHAMRSGRKGISDLTTGFAMLVFTGGMALVGQMFHLPTDWAGGAFLVCLGGLAAAWLNRSRAALAVAAVAAMSWHGARMDADVTGWTDVAVSLAFLGAVFAHPILHPSRITRWAAIVLLLVTYGRWFQAAADGLPGGDGAVLAMILAGWGGLFAVMLQLGPIADLFAKWSSYKPVRTHAHWLMARSLQDVGFLLLCVLIVSGLIAALRMTAPWSLGGLLAPVALLPLILAVLLSGVGLILSFKTAKALALFAAIGLGLSACLVTAAGLNNVILAAVSLAALTGFCAIATWFNNRFWMLCAYLGLAALGLWLLRVTIGSLLDQSLFFLLAGLLLLAIAVWLARLLRPSRAGKGGAQMAREGGLMSVSGLAADRIPARPVGLWRWGLVALIQLVLIAIPLIDRLQVQMTGEEVTLELVPVDPRDLLRGDYVTINLAINRLAADLPGAALLSAGQTVYAQLRQDGTGPATAVRLAPYRDALDGLAIAGRVTSVKEDEIRLDYGLDAFFLEEGAGLRIEQLDADRIVLVVAVSADGRSLPLRLLVDGKPFKSDGAF